MTGTGPSASALEQEHEGLLRFLNAAPVGLLQIALNGDVELANGHAAKLLLPLARDRRLHNLFDALGAQAAPLVPLIEAHGQRPGPVCDGLRLVVGGSDGERVLALTLVRVGAQQLLAALSDLTEQVRLEQALQASQLRLRLAMDALNVADFELDLDSGHYQRSPRHDRLFGHAAPLPTWSMARWTRQVHGDDVGDWLHGLQAALAGEGATWRSECRVVWPDRSVHWLSAQGHIERSEGGRARRLVGVLVDTTEQRSAATARAERQAAEEDSHRAREASRMKSQFLANMSHELRTPLNAIIGFAELLRLPGSVTEPGRQQRFLDHIASSGHHLLQLINDVLDMAKVESGKFDFHPEPLELPALAASVAGALQATIDRRGVVLQVSVDPALAQGVELDALRLKQVMFNYLSNALKHAPSGSAVQLRLLPEGPDRLRLEVEDRGPGIALSQQHRLFQEFEQLGEGADPPLAGTGLGLALTRRLVEAQGGTVGVRSAPGQPTLFLATLPRRHGRPPTADPAAPPSPRLLMLEGDEETRRRALQQLAAAGVEAEAADSVGQAEGLLQRQAFEALTLGLPLPDATGLEGLSRLRSARAAPPPPVRGLGWGAPDGSRVHFAVADVLSKPLQREALQAALADLGLLGRPRPPRVLVAEGNPVAQELLLALLGHLGVEGHGVTHAAELLPALQTLRPEALVLDLTWPDRDGLQTLHLLRREARWADLPVLLWTALALGPAERASLGRSALHIARDGGGTLEALVRDLCRWHEGLRLRHAATGAVRR